MYKIGFETLRKRDYESEHAVCIAHEGCGTEGRAGVFATVYDTIVVRIGTTRASSLHQFYFLIPAKLIHLVADVIFEALDVLIVWTAFDIISYYTKMATIIDATEIAQAIIEIT